MIPKIIHYCWFGGSEKSDIIEKCSASWREYCPNYEIIEWNEKILMSIVIPMLKMHMRQKNGHLYQIMHVCMLYTKWEEYI